MTVERLNFIDVARSWAVGLALFAHGVSTFGGMASLGSTSPFVQLLVRTATPTFVFMFGIMLELVYARRARDRGMGVVSRRLLLRSAPAESDGRVRQLVLRAYAISAGSWGSRGRGSSPQSSVLSYPSRVTRSPCLSLKAAMTSSSKWFRQSPGVPFR
jgi:hypothetical protein